jgi:hypothetical protein
MLRKIHGTNYFDITLFELTNIKCQNGPVLSLAQVFYFNDQALHFHTHLTRNKFLVKSVTTLNTFHKEFVPS